MKVGFIGLGIMGSRMAANLLRRGYELTVWNRSRPKVDELARVGAHPAGSPAEAAGGAGILFTMLADPEAVQQTALGEGGFLPALKPGSLWTDCSTVDPDFSRTMAREARERGVRFLDAPVAGTRGPAERGELSFMVGGDGLAFEECRPLLEAMGRSVVHLGETGAGTSMKMVVNVVLAHQMAALAEALRLGESMGIPAHTLFDVLLGSPAASPFMSYKREKLERREYEPDFPLRLMHKDMHLAALTAYRNRVPIPCTNAVKELFAMAERQGLGDQDLAALYEYPGR